jgi:hypothetical protein
MLRRLFGKKRIPADTTPLMVLIALRLAVERKNISYPFDDRDVGYDMAIDEVLELINDAINRVTSGNDVDYNGGM